jgi:hypothetical protein
MAIYNYNMNMNHNIGGKINKNMKMLTTLSKLTTSNNRGEKNNKTSTQKCWDGGEREKIKREDKTEHVGN